MDIYMYPFSAVEGVLEDNVGVMDTPKITMLVSPVWEPHLTTSIFFVLVVVVV
jgi:hypothetical protein